MIGAGPGLSAQAKRPFESEVNILRGLARGDIA